MSNVIIADAFEVLPNTPTNRFDLILTDPPYNLSVGKIHELHQHFLRISRGWVIVFCPPENPWIHSADQYLFWVKPISTKNTTKSYGRFVEQIFVYESGLEDTRTWNADRHWSQRNNIFFDRVDDSKLHLFRKPPSLIETLVLNHTKQGDWVLDPFAGSGVVGEVCEQHNRNCCLYDIEEK